MSQGVQGVACGAGGAGGGAGALLGVVAAWVEVVDVVAWGGGGWLDIEILPWNLQVWVAQKAFPLRMLATLQAREPWRVG